MSGRTTPSQLTPRTIVRVAGQAAEAPASSRPGQAQPVTRAAPDLHASAPELLEEVAITVTPTPPGSRPVSGILRASRSVTPDASGSNQAPPSVASVGGVRPPMIPGSRSNSIAPTDLHGSTTPSTGAIGLTAEEKRAQMRRTSTRRNMMDPKDPKADLARIGIDLKTLVVPEDLRAMLTEWDVDGDGQLSLSELLDAANNTVKLKSANANLKRLIFFGAAIALALFGVVLAIVCIGVQAMKDFVPKGDSAQLMTSSGQIVQTAVAFTPSTVGALYGQSVTQIGKLNHFDLTLSGNDEFYIISGFTRLASGGVIIYTTRGDTLYVTSATTAYVITAAGVQYNLGGSSPVSNTAKKLLSAENNEPNIRFTRF